MHFVKTVSLVISSTVFRLSLVFLAVTTPLVMVFGTPDALKHALNSSKIYEVVADDIVKTSSQDSGATSASSQDQAQIQDAAKKAIQPGFIQSSSEQIIDGTYGWLSGKTAQPEFNIDTSGVKRSLEQAIGDHVVVKAQQLPACSLQEARALAGSSVDPVNLPCLPPNYDVNLLRNEISNQLSNEEGSIFKSSAITPETLPKDENGKTVVQNLTTDAKQAPLIFSWIKRSPFIFGILAFATACLTVYLNNEKRRGLRSVAVTLLGLGVALAIGGAFTIFAFSKLAGSTGPLAGKIQGPMQQPAITAARTLINAFSSKLLIIGVAYALVGGGIMLVMHLSKPKSTPEPDKTRPDNFLEPPKQDAPTAKLP